MEIFFWVGKVAFEMEIFFTLKNLVTACIFKAAYMF
jgi:hypothetical protein